MKTVATHNSSFHADEVFAVATLEMALGDISIVRTRDKNEILKADIVVDVGREYDVAKMRFDHHQEGGAGVRENGIPYASFGLVWKQFGEQICGSKDISERIDKGLVSAIDAHDNGVELTTPIRPDTYDFNLSGVIASLNPTFIEMFSPDEVFPKAVAFAREVIARQIASGVANAKAGEIFREACKNSESKELVIVDQELSKNSWQQYTGEFPELLFVVMPYGEAWAVRAVRKELSGFENRKNLPASWAGKDGKEFEEVSGVEGAIFCHNKLFFAVVKTKEGAVALGKLALTN